MTEQMHAAADLPAWSAYQPSKYSADSGFGGMRQDY